MEAGGSAGAEGRQAAQKGADARGGVVPAVAGADGAGGRWACVVRRCVAGYRADGVRHVRIRRVCHWQGVKKAAPGVEDRKAAEE